MKLTTLFYILIICSLTLSCKEGSEKESEENKIHESIAAIENGLLPGLVLKGDSLKPKRLEEEMQKHNVVGLSIAVIDKGKIIWAKGYGMANKRLHIATDTATLFQAASISKPITAMGVLKLVEEGKLDLDIDVNNYLDDYKLKENEYTGHEKVTLRRLLNHTAGTTVHGFPGYKTSDSILSTTDVLMGKGNTESIVIDTIPGTRFKYSGGGYTIVQKVIEDVTGLEFSEFMDHKVLKPLGMHRSTFNHLSPKKDAKIASAAFDGEGNQIEGDWHIYPEKAAAALWTTPNDFAKYIVEVQEIYNGRDNGFLKTEIIKMMLSQNKHQQGLGPGLLKEGDSLRFHHSGKNAGFSNVFIANAATGQGVVMLSNSDNGMRILSSIERAIDKTYNWGYTKPKVIEAIDLSNEYLSNFVGTYKYIEQVPSVGGDYLGEVALKDNKLIAIDIPEGVEYNLIATDSLNFLDIDKNERIVFKKKNEGYILLWSNYFEFRPID